MCDEAEDDKKQIELVVDRPSDCFAAILNYYQTNELHMPPSVCPSAFRTELKFWSVAPTDLEPCCLYRYYTFWDEYETHENFRKSTFKQEMKDGLFIQLNTHNKINNVRRRVWKLADFKENTVCAKVYIVTVFVMIMLCVFTLAFSTEPMFQRPLRKCEMLEYLEHSNNEVAEYARERFGNPECSSDHVINSDEEISETDMQWQQINSETNGTGSVEEIILPRVMVRHQVFEALEYFTAVFFTVELLIRIFTCPSLSDFFTNILNIFDILAVLGFYIHIAIININKEYRYQYGWVRSISYIQIFRIMRLFRVVRNVRLSRVLTFSIRKNARDMSFLLLLFLMGVFSSASLIYFIEERDSIASIPVAWYWATITFTTVGYGDIKPTTGAGRFVAAVLGMCGVLLLSITLPMYVNNFLTLYKYSCLDKYIQERKHTRRKLKGAVRAINTMNSVDKPINNGKVFPKTDFYEVKPKSISTKSSVNNNHTVKKEEIVLEEM
ncbi:potassium voltage-gated channel subfamily B member 1-like [Mercenaria mercenaria]|uniref:potassium voltage-gated channel subfamily B member 1-like n=1 Tax=Mercenaria mercenaria TaxID=6596 RepID=UPI00234E8F68|nr:potassium voltage-gated channel subfamily B member 1-like [Mercenaria mercenaria]